MSVMLAEAIDINAADIDPILELEDSNSALDDWAQLNSIYERQGYLLFRGVLDRGSVDRALRRMMDVVARYGVVAAGAIEPLWTGKPLLEPLEESKAFSGICRELIEHPLNLAVFEKILGEKASPVPIVQYRSYPPKTPIATVHQDGFYSPGIQGFRPLWMPLMKIDREVGGLTLAPGVHKKGVLHNVAKPPIFPIPADVIPQDAWATTTYHPGDVLVIHPYTPHVGLANTSDRVRFSIDSRVQSAASPCVLLGDVISVSPNSVTLRTEQGDRTIGVSEQTYIRTGENRGVRIQLEQFEKSTPPGMRIIATLEGTNALMLRRASEA